MSDQKKLLKLEVVNEYIERLAEENGLSDTVKDLLFAQVKKLRDLYGNEIPKADFLEVISQQLNVLKTGFKKNPVDIEEFIFSQEYLNLQGGIRKPVADILIDLFENYDHCYEVLLGGAVRWGKSYLASVGMAYHIYHLSCLYDVRVHYQLSPGRKILFVIQSNNEKKSIGNFHELDGMIRSSKYFQNHFPPQNNSKKSLLLPNRIEVQPVSSSNIATMSEIIFSGMIDEANFLQPVRGSSQGEKGVDTATQLYTTLSNRIGLQFGDVGSGTWPGKIYLLSSTTHKGDFIDTKKEEAKTTDHIYFCDKAIYDVKDVDKLSGDKFWVKLPTEKDAGRILDEKPDPMTEDYIEVPIEYKRSFESNLHASIRDIAGVPLEKESKFIPSDSITACMSEYSRYYESQHLFTVQEININEVIDLNSLLNPSFIDTISRFANFYGHIDMGFTEDSVGLALGFTAGSKPIKDSDEDKEETEAEAPIYCIPGILRINPPEVGEIDVQRVQNLVLLLKDKIPNLLGFSSDLPFKFELSQTLRKNKISYEYISVDKYSEPYFGAKKAFTESRVLLPEHHVFKSEIRNVFLDAQRGKIDHEKDKSKDVADAVVGVIHRLSMLKKTWRIKGEPYTLQKMRRLMQEEEKEEQQERGQRPRRPSRPRSKTRRK